MRIQTLTSLFNALYLYPFRNEEGYHNQYLFSCIYNEIITCDHLRKKYSDPEKLNVNLSRLLTIVYFYDSFNNFENPFRDERYKLETVLMQGYVDKEGNCNPIDHELAILGRSKAIAYKGYLEAEN